MRPDIKVVHLRYCRLVTTDDSFVVTFDGVDYRLTFKDNRFSAQKGYLVERVDRNQISADFLLWLSVYLGEDALDPLQEADTRFVWHRGDFHLEYSALQRFLIAAH